MNLGMTYGGILNAGFIICQSLGIGAAINLHEYSKSVRLNLLITIAVSCLNGVPSVVFGLFGLAFLVRFFWYP